MVSVATEVSVAWVALVESPARQQSQFSPHPMGRSVPDLARDLEMGSVDRALETTETAWGGQVPEQMIVKAG
jgi:hypothetical protein